MLFLSKKRNIGNKTCFKNIIIRYFKSVTTKGSQLLVCCSTYHSLKFSAMIRLDIKKPHTYKNSHFVNQWLTSNKLLTLSFKILISEKGTLWLIKYTLPRETVFWWFILLKKHLADQNCILKRTNRKIPLAPNSLCCEATFYEIQYLMVNTCVQLYLLMIFPLFRREDSSHKCFLERIFWLRVKSCANLGRASVSRLVVQCETDPSYRSSFQWLGIKLEKVFELPSIWKGGLYWSYSDLKEPGEPNIYVYHIIIG